MKKIIKWIFDLCDMCDVMYVICLGQCQSFTKYHICVNHYYCLNHNHYFYYHMRRHGGDWTMKGKAIEIFI